MTNTNNTQVNQPKVQIQKEKTFFEKVVSFISAEQYINTRVERDLYNGLSLMFFSAIMAYYCVRNVKDTLAIDAAGSSNIISIVKSLGTVPGSILLFAVYSFVLYRVGLKNTCRTFLGLFGTGFLLTGLFVLPNFSFADPLAITSLVNTIKAFTLFGLPLDTFFFNYPISNILSTAAPLIANWPILIYYILAELYGTFAVQVIFWQVAVSNLRPEQSARLIPSIIVWGQFATFSVGGLSMLLNTLGFTTQQINAFLTVFAGLLGICIIFLYERLEKIFIENMGTVRVKEKKEKGSFIDALRTIATDEYLRLIAVIVIAYGMSMGLIEVCWKDFVAIYCEENGVSSRSIWALMSLLLGLVGIGFNLLFRGFFYAVGWKITALGTPTIMTIMGGAFFVSALLYVYKIKLGLGISILTVATIVGLMQNVFTKTVKYAFFDATKEALYVPLDSVSKSIGKPAVELIGSRLGKGASGIIGLTIINAYYISARNCIPEIATFVGVLITIWILSVFRLDTLYQEKYKAQQKEEEKNK